MLNEKYRLYGIIVTKECDYISIDEEYTTLYDAKERYKYLKRIYNNISGIMVYKVEFKLITYEFESNM